MTDGQTLYLVIAGLYLFECFHWLRLGTVAFVSPAGRNWRVRQEGTGRNKGRGFLFMGNPLPPLGQVIVCRRWPVLLSPTAIAVAPAAALAAETPPGDAGYLPFDSITSARHRGEELLVNEKRFATCSNSQQAAFFAGVIAAVAAAKENRREQLLKEALAPLFSAATLDATLGEFRRRARWLRLTCNLLFLFVFAATPLAAARWGLPWILLPAAAGMLLLSWIAAGLYYRAHRHFQPLAAGERRLHLAKMLLCPPVAMRAHDCLGESLFAAVPAPALACRLLRPRHLLPFSVGRLRQLQHPVTVELCTGPAAAVAAWQRGFCRDQILALLRELKLDPAQLLAEPFAAEPTAKLYCPRCLCQFTDPALAECPDCSGIKPLPLKIAP